MIVLFIEYVLIQTFTILKAGGCAGTSVDVTLFPLDTLKTRLQSAEGFKVSGGFKGIYNGIGPAVLASAPNGIFIILFIIVFFLD